MKKIRIYELAKELNTTSKRLMEKLAEVDIIVKNHMSFLEENELKALYDHIGVIQHSNDKKVEVEEKKAVSAPQAKKDTKKDNKKDAKSAPRIIRKTEIIIDTGANDESTSNFSKRNTFLDKGKRDNRGNQNRDFVRTADANSGLRAGFVRDTTPVFKKTPKSYPKSNTKDNVVEPIKKEQQIENKIEQQRESTIRQKKEGIQEPIKIDKVELETAPAKDTIVESEIKQANAHEVKQGESVDQKPSEKNIEKTMPQENEIKTEQQVEKQITDKKLHENKGDMLGVQDGNMNMDNSSRGHETGKSSIETSAETEKVSVEKPLVKEEKLGDGVRKSDTERKVFDARKESGGRPKGQGSDKPQYNKGQGSDRPQYNRGANSDRPPYNKEKGNDKPQYNRGANSDRPQYNRERSSDRTPFNRGSNDKPQFNRGQSGDRPQYNKGQNEGYPRTDDSKGKFDSRNDRRGPVGSRPSQKPLEIPMPELTLAQKEEIASQRAINRREIQNKDIDKDIKREQRKETVKGQVPVKSKKLKPHVLALNEKKGVSEILSDDFALVEEFFSDDSIKKTKKPPRQRKDNKGQVKGNEVRETKHIPHKAVLTSIKIPDSITVKDLAEALKKTSAEVIKKLMNYGQMVALNQEIDFETATIIADEFGVKTEKEVIINEEDILFDDAEEKEEDLQPRPPVVVVMGHVDHGKTSLLDAIRKAHVTEVEAGGITQHIGAYTVKINNRNITFLDTPGHEAFTAMRARGAQVTDIAILVVAADDGVMPQTIEAINHAKAANVSIIVAVNKIDKPSANPERVKQELTEYGLVVEEWGGDTICVPVSAKNNENIDNLLEMVLLTADMMELKANPNKQAKGTVVEAQLDKNRGPIATLLVQRGTLNVGDSIISGTTFGRIRGMVDDKGNSIKSAGPSTPVEIIGLPEVPEAGEIFYVVSDEKVAKQLVEKRKSRQREQLLKSSAKISLDDLFNQIKEGKVKDLNIIVKADVQGSVEAVKQSLEKLSNDEVRINIIHGAVGAITESDVSLADVSNAIIIGFNVRPGANVLDAAKDAGVDLRLYRIIYNAIEDIEAAMKGMLDPTFKEVILGHTEIRQIFKVSGIGTIGGCYVLDGKITRNSDIRVVRDGIVIHEGKLASLKRFKDDAREVVQGFECGLSVERFNDIKEGDIVESYMMEEVAR